MSFNLKPQQQSGNSESSVDYAAIAEQVEDGPNGGVISLIVDLGIQDREEACSTDGKKTVVETEDDAIDLVERAKEMTGKDVGYTKHDDGFEVACSIYKPKDAQEVAIFADFPDTMVEYGSLGKMPYRIMLNNSFKGVIKGMVLAAAPPKTKGGIWTFAGNSILSKLAYATKQTQIVEDGNDNMNIGLLLGKPLLVDLRKSGNFINAKGFMSLMKGQVVGELPATPVGLSFDGATVEAVEAACLRKAIKDKIKAAKNYSGSAMEKAIEQAEANWAASNSGGGSSAPTAATKPVNVQVEAEDDDFGDVPF